MVEFIPGGELITQALDNYDIFDRVGAFVEEQISSLGMTAGAIGNAVTEFISSLSAERHSASRWCLGSRRPHLHVADRSHCQSGTTDGYGNRGADQRRDPATAGASRQPNARLEPT